MVGERFPAARVELVDAGPALAAALDAWKEHARPLRVGGLHVRYPWSASDDDPPRAAEQVLVVDPCRAFGSGTAPEHPRRASRRWPASFAPARSVLDVGCGSGILAVAAATLGAARVVAIDVDPEAVSATATNAARNGCTVDASTTPVDAVAGTFDLVVANIGAGTLIDLAVPIAARVADDGVLVLAGLLEVHAGAVASAYARLGLQLGSTEVDGGWAVQELQRGSTTAPS